MASSLPSVHRGAVLLGTPGAASLPPPSGPPVVVNSSWTHRFSDEGLDAGRAGSPFMLIRSGATSLPGAGGPGPGGALGGGGGSQQELPTTAEGLHRYLRDKVSAALSAARPPLASTAGFTSPAPYSLYTISPPGSPQRPGRDASPPDRPPPTAGTDRSMSPPPGGRMISHDAFVSRPSTSAAERIRLFTGSSHDLRSSLARSGPGSGPGSGAGATPSASVPSTPSAAQAAAARDMARARSRARASQPYPAPPGSPHASPHGPLHAPPPGAIQPYQMEVLALPPPPRTAPAGATRSTSPRPSILAMHPVGSGSAAAAVAVMAASQAQISRAQAAATAAQKLDRLVALDVEAQLSTADSPKSVTTLTPGSLDGMGHPVLIAADGARIHKKIDRHLPRHAATRMNAGAPARLDELGLLPDLAMDPELSYIDNFYGTADDEGEPGQGPGQGFVSPRPQTSPATLPRVGARGFSRGGGGPVGLLNMRAGAARAGGGGGGGMNRSHSSSPGMRRRLAGNDGTNGSGGAAGSGTADPGGGVRPSRMGGGPAGPSTAATTPGGDGRPSPTSALELRAGESFTGPGLGLSIGGGDNSYSGGPLSPDGGGGSPKLFGMYMPKEDPLGLWMGKRMTKTEMVVEKRLYAMRHNPGMRLELEGRAGDALRARAAQQAEVAAISQQREAEAAARKAQLRADLEARRRGLAPRHNARSPKRGPQGLTRDAKRALERRLMEERFDEVRGPLSRDEAAARIQAAWRMYRQRRSYLRTRGLIIRLQRACRLRYCVVRTTRRHRTAAHLLLDFLQAIIGTRQASAAMDLRELHSNYLRRRLLEKKGDLRYQTAVAILVREWDMVESRILALGTRAHRMNLKGAGNAAIAAVGFAAVAIGGGDGSGSGGGAKGGKGGKGGDKGGGGGGGEPDHLSDVAGDAGSAAHGTRLLGRALEARRKGVMLVAEGTGDLNKQLTVEHALAHAVATDKVVQENREPVAAEVKAAVCACYMEHKSHAYNALVGVIWLRRARWFGLFKQQRQMAMARSVVATGSAWQEMDELTLQATVALAGPLPQLPRMRITATLRELRCLMQAGVQEAALFTAYMVRGGIHELEKRLHNEMLMRSSFGRILSGNNVPRARESRDSNSPAQLSGLAPSLPLPRQSNNGGGAGPASPRGMPPRRISLAGLPPGGGGGGAGASVPPSPFHAAALRRTATMDPHVMDSPTPMRATGLGFVASLATAPSAPSTPLGGTRSRRGMMLGGASRARIDPAAINPTTDPNLDTISEVGSADTTISTAQMVLNSGPAAARARFLASQPSQKAGVAQLKERWWRDAVVRVDACLKKRYKMNNVSLVVALEDTTAPAIELFASRLSEINANPEKAEALLAALPGGGLPAGVAST
ncbi:hypothetical protein HYH03_009862 [Edaphochlamys debaryana]|uniref:Uncharacterized protein n=1 Tax=Edaphochlamys debaryana TaxID=47281 RepID=A0A835Y6I0_9CHLO|nr:hypothetical protein HYH03_009862 [Edaphochlamys debaryana]|eukprot:KAG2491914.1 hypothetical protein HYH03_009862 [Edaphochlamys debaryana]